MGKRTIIECDLCHNESSSEDELTSFTFKSPGKQKGRTYEVCKECASTIETQLVSNNTLSPGWGFGSGKAAEKNASQTQQPDGETVAQRRARLESAEPSADDLLILSKGEESRASLEALEERPQERAVAGPATVQATDKKGKCLHYNKTPPMLGNIDGKKGFVSRCRDCGELVSLRQADDRHSVTKIKEK